MKKNMGRCFILFVLGVAAVPALYSQVAGDFGTRNATGAWATATDWLVFASAADWSDAAVATGTPTSTKNVWIRSGHTMTTATSTNSFANLYIEAGGVYKGDAAASISSPRTLRVYGTSIVVNGTFGNASGGSDAGINLEFQNNVVISGSGTMAISRLRSYNSAPAFTCTIDKDIKLQYSGYAMQCYENGAGYTINAGKTVTFAAGSSLGSGSGSAGFAGSVTVNVYGTLDLSAASNCGVNMKTITAGTNVGTLRIYNGGTVKIGGNLQLTNATDLGSGELTVENGGTLSIGGSADYGVAAATCNGTLIYNGTAAQSTGALPSPLNNLTINNAAGVTLSQPVTVNGVLTLAAGLFNNLGVAVTLGPGGSLVNTGGSISEAPLPVELTSFAVTVLGRRVELTWATATEKNNSGFSVEKRAADGKWRELGFVKGNGTTNVPQKYAYTDAAVSGGACVYRLKQVDNDGRFEYSKEVEAAVALQPEDFSMAQNYPNPFNPATSIRFAVKATQHASLKVYNLTGQEVATLFDGTAIGGAMNTVSFDASHLASGTYIYRLTSAERSEVKRMILMK